MELLRRTGGRRARLTCVALTLMLLCAAGCVLLDGFGPAQRRFAFAHALHGADQGLTCLGCHADAQAGDAPGLPSPDTCAVCHDELDAAAPPERAVATLFDGEDFRAAHAGRQSAEIVFSHALHAARLECNTCHRGIESNQDVLTLGAATMDDCTACHAREKVANECATCHREVTQAWKPPSHAADWERGHGLAVRSLSDASTDDCALCHTESSCLICHKEEPPRSHTHHFRQRGHAIQAALDRQNCAACHEPDSCDACHREVQPKSHTGSFSGTLSTHCLGCHFPLNSQGCATCHTALPGHMATPKPPDHTPVMNCRQCHGFLAPLPHVDKGDDCNACHP